MGRGCRLREKRWKKGIGKGGCSTLTTRQNTRDRSCTQRQSPGRRGVPGQSRKASTPTSTGPAGSVMSPKDEHPLKASTPILVRLGGSVISTKDVQWSKADPPILVRLGGSVISVKDVHW